MKTSSEIIWEELLERQLPLLGHRNWIVVADGAYPWQTAPGVETVCTGAGQLDVLRAVLAAIDSASHVRPLVYIDAELPFLAEDDAPGITTYRGEL
jgi:L-fucose mutarotase/ribose pyranase (RbsD/FucU family)